MAIVTRRYAPVGASDPHLIRFGSTAVVQAKHHVAAVDYQIDDAVVGAVDDLDWLLAQLGYEYAPDAPVAGRQTLPEVWAYVDVDDTVVDVPMMTQVSTMFDTFKVMRPGSVVGISTRFVNVIAGGDVTIYLLIDGLVKTLSITNGIGSSGGIVTQAAGVDEFIAGSIIGVWITTTAGLVMNSVEATLQIEESA